MAHLTDKQLDAKDFINRVVESYNHGTAEEELEANAEVARSIIPAATGAFRDFSYIAPEIPEFIAENCVGCMDCVTECPDTAILAKVIPDDTIEKSMATHNAAEKQQIGKHWAKTQKYYELPVKKGQTGGKFGIFIDPTKCKGCAECVTVCGPQKNALKMIPKNKEVLDEARLSFKFYKQETPPTPKEFINEKILADLMLKDESLLYVGGAGSCMGCGEGTALRMLMAATGFVYPKEDIGIVAATGCNTVYSSTYPYNPFATSWTNSLFENAPADAMGVRMRWDQQGWQKKRLWVIGGDGAMNDIGFQSLSRLLVSGADIKVFVMDTQVYSNTGGQASTGTYMAQNAKMANHGTSVFGKTERRKELALIAAMHPDVFVAQTTAAHINHFYKAVMTANEFPGPAVINVYTTCQPEHGVADNMASAQAKLAVDTRAFPLFIYDPRKGETMAERFSLQGNPAVVEDWYVNPKTGKAVDFVEFARSEGRFMKQFDKDGNPSEIILNAQSDRLKNWRTLQDLAGVKRK
jgi:pyruvate/2-oxoacid:ferredoxin oxidoreductase beta subunit/ferredoxin